MHYKTIILDLIQDQPDLYERLRLSKQVLSTVETYATELKASHEAWKQQLSRSKPGSDSRQIASEAMELAIEAISDHLRSASQTEEAEPLFLDAAMRFIRQNSQTT